MLTDLDTPRFSTAQIVRVAHVSTEVFGIRFNRKAYLFPPSTVGSGGGKLRVFSLRTTLHVALTEELARSGVGVRRASSLALLSTDLLGSQEVGSSAAEVTSCSRRGPCQLFEDDVTVLRVVHVAGQEPRGSIVRLRDVDHSAVLSATLINLNVLVDRVLSALSISTEFERSRKLDRRLRRGVSDEETKRAQGGHGVSSGMLACGTLDDGAAADADAAGRWRFRVAAA